MNWNDVKKHSKQAWDFIWNDNSIWSWMLNILIAFVLIKFIIYPGVGVLLGTNLPIVAVVSGSMQHDGSFNSWWNSPAICMQGNQAVSCTQGEWYDEKGINESEFLSFPLHNGFSKGDIIILRGTSYTSLHIGDILVYQTGLPYPVIHRVVEKADTFQTKGDHNQAQIQDSQVNELYVTKDQIIGKAWFKVPYIGYVKIYFTELAQCIVGNGCQFG